MATNQEEVAIKLGIDAAGVAVGLDKAVAMNKGAAKQILSDWGRMNAERSMMTEKESIALESRLLEIEVEGATRRNKARQLLRERETAQIARQAKINAEIEAGSGGFGWAGGMSGNGGGGAAEGVGKEAEITRRELSHLAHLSKEIGEGNWAGAALGAFRMMGKTIAKITSSLMGPFGIALAVVGVAAYKIWEDIKEFNKEADKMGKMNAESIGDTHKAITEATDAGIKSAEEFEGHIRSLADAHETLAHWVERVNGLLAKNAEQEEKLIKSKSEQQVAAINLAEHMGMMSPGAASAARTQAQVFGFTQAESLKQQALLDQGHNLATARGDAAADQPYLEQAARAAQAAVTGVDEHGNITNHAAFARNKQMKERANLEADINKRQEKVNEFDESFGDFLNPTHKWSEKLNDQEKSIIEKGRALLESKEEQNRGNIAAQQAAVEAYKRATKAVDENAENLKQLNIDLDNYREKYKNNATAMEELKSHLTAQQSENQQAQFSTAAAADRVTPTIEMLAGKEYTDKLNADYGESGYKWTKDRRGKWRRGEKIKGKYDLESGDGPFANIAQEYELSQKQQMWDTIHGNAQFNDKGELVGGQALADKNRSTQLHNMLAGAGLDTPEMKMSELVENGRAIQGELASLNAMISQGTKVTVTGTE